MNIYKIKCESIEILLEQDACPSETQVFALLKGRGIKCNWLNPARYTASPLTYDAKMGGIYWGTGYTGMYLGEVNALNFQGIIRSILDDSPLSIEVRRDICEYTNLCLSHGYSHQEAVMKTASFVNNLCKSLANAPAA